jgi:hypothetical protein
MNKIIASLALAFAFALPLSAITAQAADKPPTAQQQRMKDCNAAATGKTGADRKTFMSDCLKNGVPASTTAVAPAAATSTCPPIPDTKGMSQPDRMKACGTAWTKEKATAGSCTYSDFSKLCLKSPS